MAADGITKPTDKRPNYFAGQYLLEEDFQDEQQYHIDRQRWHHHLLHISGIAEGLKVEKGDGNLVVNISEGSAIDIQGRQIIVLNPPNLPNTVVNLTEIFSNNNAAIPDGTYTLYIGYDEQKTDQQNAGDDITDSRRWQEKPKFQLSSDNLTASIPLAKVTISNAVIDDKIDNSVRVYSGLRLPSYDGEITLRAQKGENKSLAELNGSLSIAGTLSVTGNVGIGTTNPPTEKLEIGGNLKVSGGDLKVSGNLSATNATLTGNVGIGTTPGTQKLEVSGNIKATGSITGNSLSATGKISATDAELTNNLSTSGAIKPSAGNDATKGIMFPENPGGGGGDAAWIRYYSRNPNATTTPEKEQLTLEIGIANDANDHIALMASGNVGIGTTTPATKLEVSGGDLKVSGNIAATNATLTGNLGIGTTNPPTEKLEISGGNLKVSGNIAATNATLTGNLGIGTTNPPTEKLEISGGNLKVSGNIAATNANLGGNLSVTGNVGIGTTSPNEKLEVSGNLKVNGSMTSLTSINFSQSLGQKLTLYSSDFGIGIQNSTQYFRTFQNFAWYKGGSHNDNLLNAGPSGIVQMVINNNNVGIGTTTPTEKLEITGGNLKVSGNIYATNATLTGNVGIGTTSPSRTLTIKADYSVTADAQQLLIQGSTNTNYQLLLGYHTTDNYGSIQAINQTVGVRPLALNPAGGNVGIGTTSTSANLTIQTPNNYDGDTIRFEVKKEPSLYYLNLKTSAGDSVVRWVFDQNNNGTPYPNVLAFDRGKIGIGTATPLQTLDVNGRIHVSNGVIQRGGDTATTAATSDLGLYSQVDANWIRLVTKNAPIKFFSDGGTGTIWNMSIEADGNVKIRGALNSSNNASDIRLKNNITPLTNVLEKLEKIRGISFEWNELSKSLGFSVGQREIGVIAQEVETEFPELVYSLEAHEYKAVSYDKLAGVFIEAIKELKTKHDDLVRVHKGEIETLKAEIKSLKSLLTQPA